MIIVDRVKPFLALDNIVSKSFVVRDTPRNFTSDFYSKS